MANGPDGPQRQQRRWRRSVGVAVVSIILLLTIHGTVQPHLDATVVRWGVLALTLTGVAGIAVLGYVVWAPLEERRSSASTIDDATDPPPPDGARVKKLETEVHELEQANAELRNFAQIASHDLKEPLRMVASYLGLLEEELGEDLGPERRAYLEHALDGARRMSDLIDGLSALARVEAEAIPTEVFDLDASLDDALENLSVQIEDTGAGIERGDLPAVRGHQAQLAQVFQNLVSNAIKFRHEDRPPRVRIHAEQNGDRWSVHVQDNGTGFDPERGQRLFELFQRDPDTEDRPGTGVGLSVCKRIVERHGGNIEATSTPGEGSVFTFHLPVPEKTVPALGARTIEERSLELV